MLKANDLDNAQKLVERLDQERRIFRVTADEKFISVTSNCCPIVTITDADLVHEIRMALDKEIKRLTADLKNIGVDAE